MLEPIHSLVLKALRYALFEGQKPQFRQNVDLIALLDEAKAQAVFPLVYSVYQEQIKSLSSPELYQSLDEEYFSNLTNTIRVQMEHDECHQIMTTAKIPYVILKGCASAAYYPEPELRSMGDVDFLVHEKDIPRGIIALEKHGFQRDQYEFTTNQSAYHRPPMTTWEIHKEPTGIPKNEVGDLIRKELSSIIESAEAYERDGVSFYMPSRYHHGIILLLHKISHMTTTGIGLRHLCDWAVFECSFSNDEFISLFESKLKSFGIWKFAQIMTLLCEKYLGSPKKEWAQNKIITSELLEQMMKDILIGGNFGKKDGNRQREIKYLTDRDHGTLGHNTIFGQALKSLNSKVYVNHPFINNVKLLTPVGWIIEGGKYFYLCVSGKRKTTRTKEMIKEAKQRKNMYLALDLFEQT